MFRQNQGYIMLPIRVQNWLVVLNLGGMHDYEEKLDLLIEIINYNSHGAFISNLIFALFCTCF